MCLFVWFVCVRCVGGVCFFVLLLWCGFVCCEFAVCVSGVGICVIFLYVIVVCVYLSIRCVFV